MTNENGRQLKLSIPMTGNYGLDLHVSFDGPDLPTWAIRRVTESLLAQALDMWERIEPQLLSISGDTGVSDANIAVGTPCPSELNPDRNFYVEVEVRLSVYVEAGNQDNALQRLLEEEGKIFKWASSLLQHLVEHHTKENADTVTVVVITPEWFSQGSPYGDRYGGLFEKQPPWRRDYGQPPFGTRSPFESGGRFGDEGYGRI